MKLPALPRTGAVASVLLGLGAAVLTNLITDRWSWAIAVALGVNAIVWATVEAWRSTPDQSPAADLSVTQKVKRVSGRVIGIRRTEGSGIVQQTVGEVADEAEVVGFEQNWPRDVE